MAAASRDILRALVPLKVVLLAESPPREHGGIRSSISRGFQGGATSADTTEAYFAAGEDLGVSVIEALFTGEGTDAKRMVETAREDALHVLVVVLLYEPPSPAFQTWLAALDQEAQNETEERPALRLLPIQMRCDTWSGATHAMDYTTLGESALRAAYAAAHVLVNSWSALSAQDERLKIFISHAKLDGVPLAHAFRHQLDSFRGTTRFYDVDDIPPGSNWRRVLRKGVEESVLIALRTNVYEERFWCVQEMDWAEDFGCPVVMLDARTQLVRAREFLPVGGAPSVQISDGNLLRVLQSGLREALRVRLFVRQVDALADLKLVEREQVLKVPRTSLATLGMRCQDRARASNDVSHVFVPEPFRETHREVAAKLVDAYFPGAWLGTPKMLASGTVTGGTV